MIIQRTYQLDLLRKRREVSRTNKTRSSNIKKLRKKGFLYGFLISSIGIFICGFTSVHTYRRIQYKKKLTLNSSEYQFLKTKYNSTLSDLRSIYKINNQISKGIIGIKSGSALLLELRDKLPTTIQLKRIKVKGNKLTLDGIADQPYSLNSINHLKLQVSNSFLVDNQSTFLSKAWNPNNENEDSLNFTLNSSFSNPTSQELMSNYSRLGSLGLLRRVNLLKQEGLIK